MQRIPLQEKDSSEPEDQQTKSAHQASKVKRR